MHISRALCAQVKYNIYVSPACAYEHIDSTCVLASGRYFVYIKAYTYTLCVYTVNGYTSRVSITRHTQSLLFYLCFRNPTEAR